MIVFLYIILLVILTTYKTKKRIDDKKEVEYKDRFRVGGKIYIFRYPIRKSEFVKLREKFCNGRPYEELDSSYMWDYIIDNETFKIR